MCRTGLILTSPELEPKCMSIEYTIHLLFKEMNNKAQYEALHAGLHLVRSLGIERLHIYNDLQLIIRQVTEEYQARKIKMQAYLDKVKVLLAIIEDWTLTQVPYTENEVANSLTMMASISPMNITWYIPVKLLYRLSIKEVEVLSVITLDKPSWKDDIITYLLEGKLLEDKVKAHKLCCRAASYMMIGG